MSYKVNNSVSEVLLGIGCLPMIVSVLFIGGCVLNITKVYDSIVNGDVKLLSLIFSAVTCIVLYIILTIFCTLKDKYDFSIRQIKEQSDQHQKELEKQFKIKEDELQSSIKKKEEDIQRRENIIKGFVDSLDKEQYCSELISDFKTVLYEEARKRLVYKYHAAPVAAETVRQLRAETRRHIEELQKYKYKENERISKIENAAQQKVNQANNQCLLLQKIAHDAEERLKSSTPFKEVANLYADALAVAYGDIATELRKRVRPANSTADKIERELKKKIREIAYEAKESSYRWNFLLSIHPELKEYIFDDNSLMSMAEYADMDDFNENRDRARDYLSEEEYSQLSDTQKYQLALDRYKERRRSNAWIAGVEYEMFCSYQLRKKGYYVIEHGVSMKKADLGRDIIAQKDGTTYIIQCKRYSLQNLDGTDKYVHENVICQLYGTTIEYQITHPDNTLFSASNKVIPVLCTTGRLSDIAKIFADRLKVQIFQFDMGDYPMIKCNINDNEKIYHLPFDQQYWRTKIERSDEFYAWTVQEAEQAGFRRALRWRG